MEHKTGRTKTVGTIYKRIVTEIKPIGEGNIKRIHYELGFNNSSWKRMNDIGEQFVRGGDLGLDDRKHFVINNYNRQKFENLIKYIQGDRSCNWDINKALGFIGGTGIGKTLAFQMAIEFMAIDDIMFYKSGKQIHFRFKIHSARQIVSDFATNGFDGIEKYIVPNILCIDDLGTENDNSQHFGNKINVIEQILEERYLYKKLTHFSSNFDIEDIGKKYGERVKSRIIQGTNLIEWIGEDWRKKQK